ncbi:MAG: site-specific integrase [Candidatus Heimdallarchaeum endolithica]|uniref:Site-specific integrase n=1 Tax=Candidatus Heimdallarchaeum endolithica TaxID=2876572 RepID=A0A9Y1BRG9_9ARCH|nr:MAG: site-specific integrase [Candidatus Heimdallarchaeum endolithica]
MNDRDFRVTIPSAPISPNIDNFLKIKILQVRPITYRGYYRRLFRFYKYAQTDIVTEAILQDFLTYISKKVGNSQYNQYLNTLKQYTRYLADRRIIDSAEFLNSYKSKKKIVKREKHYYPDHEIEQFLNEVLTRKFPRWLYWFIWLGFQFGIRPKEMSLLEVTDINLENWTINLRSEITKTKVQSLLPIPTILRPKIKQLLSWRKLQNTQSTRLFVNSWGDAITEGNLSNHRAALRAIDGKFTYYDMRYTAGWRCYERSGDIYLAARLLRHSDINQTKKYLQIEKEKALEQMRKKFEEVYK